MRRALERRRRIVAAALLTIALALPAPRPTVAPADPAHPLLAAVAAPAAIAGPVPQTRPAGIRDARAAQPRSAAATLAHLERLRTDRFDAALHAALADSRAYGIGAAVARDGEIVWAAAAGLTGEGGRALQASDPMVVGSVTKTFVAAAVMQLAHEGRIDLDRAVRRYLPDLPIRRGITVRQLLDHTSGLADLFNDATRTAIEQDPERAWTPEELFATLHTPWYRPGEGWAYANTNYLILALLVEERTGGPLADELTRRFLEPLGLLDTAVIASDASGAALSAAWATIFWGSGAMTSTASDLARWGDALYAGSVLDPASRSAMLAFNGHDHGLGVQRLELAGVVGYGHTGLLDHYTTLLLHIPSERATIALLVNRSGADLGALLRARPDDGASLVQLVRRRP